MDPNTYLAPQSRHESCAFSTRVLRQRLFYSLHCRLRSTRAWRSSPKILTGAKEKEKGVTVAIVPLLGSDLDVSPAARSLRPTEKYFTKRSKLLQSLHAPMGHTPPQKVTSTVRVSNRRRGSVSGHDQEQEGEEAQKKAIGEVTENEAM